MSTLQEKAGQILAHRLQALVRKSTGNAEKVFENFSLSKFPKDSLPSNYVHPYKRDASMHQAERTKHVQDFQRKNIEHYLHKLKTAEQQRHKAPIKTAVRGITVALLIDQIHKNLPSYKKEKGTIELGELMDLVETNRRERVSCKWRSDSEPARVPETRR